MQRRKEKTCSLPVQPFCFLQSNESEMSHAQIKRRKSQRHSGKKGAVFGFVGFSGVNAERLSRFDLFGL